MNRRGFLRSLLVAAALTIAPSMPVAALRLEEAKAFVRKRGAWISKPEPEYDLELSHRMMAESGQVTLRGSYSNAFFND